MSDPCGRPCLNPLCVTTCFKPEGHPSDHRHLPHPFMTVSNLTVTHLGGHMWSDGGGPPAWLMELDALIESRNDGEGGVDGDE